MTLTQQSKIINFYDLFLFVKFHTLNEAVFNVVTEGNIRRNGAAVSKKLIIIFHSGIPLRDVSGFLDTASYCMSLYLYSRYGRINLNDNDSFAAALSVELDVELLILLSNVDGIFTGPPEDASSRLIQTFNPQSMMEVRRIFLTLLFEFTVDRLYP